MLRKTPASERPAVAALRERRQRMKLAREEQAARDLQKREEAARKRRADKQHTRDVATAVRHTALKLESDRTSFAADLDAAQARSLVSGKSLLVLALTLTSAATSSGVIAHYARAPLPLDQAFATMPFLLAGYIIAAFAAWCWLWEVFAPWWTRNKAAVRAARFLERTECRASSLKDGNYVAVQSTLRAGRWPDTPLEIRFPSDEE